MQRKNVQNFFKNGNRQNEIYRHLAEFAVFVFSRLDEVQSSFHQKSLNMADRSFNLATILTGMDRVRAGFWIDEKCARVLADFSSLECEEPV